MKVNILSAKQITIQEPLCEKWMVEPLTYSEDYVRAIDPDFKQFISAGDARRMGKLMKRALATSISALNEGGTVNPDAIITGTGFGSVENTELFLDALVRNGEQMLKPTLFMQSTHNTASSLIGIHTHSHGYNSTYSQKGLSFDSALYDAWLQFRLGKIGNALVGAHDEMSPVFSTFMRKAGHVKDGEICSEAAVSVLLSSAQDTSAAPYCTLNGVKILNMPNRDTLCQAVGALIEQSGVSRISAVITGTSGNAVNDSWYSMLDGILDGVPRVGYKNLFGVTFASSAVGFYVAACSLRDGFIPASLTGKDPIECKDAVLIVNVVDGCHYSLSILESVCGK